jgi:phosphoadenosine phosphosulfate reductase
LPFSDSTFDAVMFHAALGNMDAMVALAEASRVLKPGGVLFLNELCRVAGDNAEMERLLSFRAYPTDQLRAFAMAIGFERFDEVLPVDEREYLREQMDADDYRRAFAGVVPVLWRAVKGPETPMAARFGAIFARHERIALQVSGGKDSLAVLEGLRPWWDRLCVYWLNPGDPFPETVALMAEIRAVVPHFVEVVGRQAAVIAADGWPSDVVPQHHTSDGNFVFGETPFKVQTRLNCCIRALMLPMHERMVSDGVTCVIRGKRAEEKDRTGTRTGSIAEGIEFIYPVWDWSDGDVRRYLDRAGIALPATYKYAGHSLDCMSCTAWWGEGLSRFLEAKYPDRHREYVRRITLIKQAVATQMADCEV